MDENVFSFKNASSVVNIEDDTAIGPSAKDSTASSLTFNHLSNALWDAQRLVISSDSGGKLSLCLCSRTTASRIAIQVHGLRVAKASETTNCRTTLEWYTLSHCWTRGYAANRRCGAGLSNSSIQTKLRR